MRSYRGKKLTGAPIASKHDAPILSETIVDCSKLAQLKIATEQALGGRLRRRLRDGATMLPFAPTWRDSRQLLAET